MPKYKLHAEGADLTGREVQYCGHRWKVKGKNYLGDWDVVREETRPDGVYIIRSTIAPRVLPADHPHYASLHAPQR